MLVLTKVYDIMNQNMKLTLQVQKAFRVHCVSCVMNIISVTGLKCSNQRGQAKLLPRSMGSITSHIIIMSFQFLTTHNNHKRLPQAIGEDSNRISA